MSFVPDFSALRARQQWIPAGCWHCDGSDTLAYLLRTPSGLWSAFADQRGGPFELIAYSDDPKNREQALDWLRAELLPLGWEMGAAALPRTWPRNLSSVQAACPAHAEACALILAKMDYAGAHERLLRSEVFAGVANPVVNYLYCMLSDPAMDVGITDSHAQALAVILGGYAMSCQDGGDDLLAALDPPGGIFRMELLVPEALVRSIFESFCQVREEMDFAPEVYPLEVFYRVIFPGSLRNTVIQLLSLHASSLNTTFSALAD